MKGRKIILQEGLVNPTGLLKGKLWGRLIIIFDRKLFINEIKNAPFRGVGGTI
jgi:hypothetical protein